MMNDAGETYDACARLLDEGRYREALALAETITDPANRAAIYIDGGFALGQSGKVREGTEIIESLLSKDELDRPMTRSTLLYNAGNGRSSLYTLRRRNRAKTIPPNDVDLRAAKRHYRNAVAAARDRDKAFVSQVLVNYGNSLSAFGRYAEAIENYQQALDVDPKNGMAAGNLGVELEYAARLTGRFRHEYIALAREFLIRALGPHMHLDYGIPHAVQGFRLVLERLDQFINFHTTPILPPQPVKVAARTESQRRYVRFCIQNGLFLNAWVGNHELSPGVTDNISFGPIRTPIADIVLVPELLHILNEVKEAYATARYVYYLSQAQSNLFDAVSKATIYFDIDSYEINGLYTGLCKTAYSRAFDVLDKTARLINSYFDIGKREDSFWRIL